MPRAIIWGVAGAVLTILIDMPPPIIIILTIAATVVGGLNS